MHFTTLVTTRIDATVNFSWTGSPVPGGQSDNFSVRWTGQVQPQAAATTRFATISDDGVRLWVNGQFVIDNWTDHGTTMNTGPVIALTAGVRYDIRMEFYDRAMAVRRCNCVDAARSDAEGHPVGPALPMKLYHK